MVERNRGERSRVLRMPYPPGSNMGWRNCLRRALAAGPAQRHPPTPWKWGFHARNQEGGPCRRPPLESDSASQLLAFEADALEPLLELGELAAGVDQAVDARPGRMRLGVDVQAQRVTRLAHGRAGLEAAAVGHHHGDLVVVRVDALLHGLAPKIRGAGYSEAGRGRQGLRLVGNATSCPSVH